MGFFSNFKAKMDAAPKVDPMFQNTMILLYNLAFDTLNSSVNLIYS